MLIFALGRTGDMPYFCTVKPITIAVDGFSATGKSTTAKAVAARLGYVFIDSGAMYRAVALYCLDHAITISPSNPVLEASLAKMNIDFRLNPESGNRDLYLNGVNVEMEIRSLRVSEVVSEIAAISSVRRKLVAMQKEMGKNGGVVMDGRDIGTVVFPQAELKIFLTASMDVRVVRRMNELTKKGKPATADEVRANILHRDHIDSNREDSPLRKASDAIEIDTTNHSIASQVDIVVGMAQDVIQGNKLRMP
jgi:CMP/dCMP kinase